MTVGSETAKTEPVKNNLNPCWNKTFEFSSTDGATDVMFTVFDWDRSSKNDPMGRVVVPLSSLPQYGEGTESDAQLQQMGGCKDPQGKLRFCVSIAASPVDKWRAEMLRELTSSWLTMNSVSTQVLKPPSTAINEIEGWHKRLVIVTEGMFIYTTAGRMVAAQQAVAGFGNVKMMSDPPLDENGNEPRKYQLRGRIRVSPDARVTVVQGSAVNERTDLIGEGEWQQRVFGLDFTPNPHAVGPSGGPKTFRLYASSEAERDWLRASLELNIRYVQQKFGGGTSSETEYTTSAGLGGQVMGALAGDDIRGRSRPSRR
jgi:hypothetical protein